jgi:hypothetical protein
MEKSVKYLIAPILAFLLAGCSAMAIPVSNQMNYDPSEQRAAIKGVAVVDIVPEGATVLGVVKAERCHRNWNDEPPGETALKIDLQLSAYGSGADGIADVQYGSEGLSSLGQNCWKIFSAKATAYILTETGS